MVLLNEPKKNKFPVYITDVLITSGAWPYRCIFPAKSNNIIEI